MAAKKSVKKSLRAGDQARPRVFSEEFKNQMFKPGVSGNPGGRAKKLSGPLEEFLARKDKSGKQYAELLIEAMVKRAIKKSDSMVKEIFERVEGHVPVDPALAAQFGVKVIVLDMPRPPKLINGKRVDGDDDGD